MMSQSIEAKVQDNVDGVSVYEALADAESDPKTAAVYRRLAAVERAHADYWAKRLDRSVSRVRPSSKARLLSLVGRRLGPSMVLPFIPHRQSPASGRAGPPVGQGHRPPQSHAEIVQGAAEEVGGLSGAALAQIEGRGGGGGNALRAAVLGANDGLVSNLSLVMGVAGATANGHTILLTGLAGLVAGSCSMAMGEWLSVNSAREMGQRQIDGRAHQLDQDPETEKRELELIYQGKGLDKQAARTLADRLFQSHDAVLDTLAREELGIDPEELGGSAWAASASSFCLFATGAIFPVFAFFFVQGWTAILMSVALSGLALCAIGAVTTRFTGRGVFFSAMRQLAIGYAAAALTYGVGRLIGVRPS